MAHCEQICKDLIVHHDQLGIGKVHEVATNGDVWVSFLFYGPKLKVARSSIEIVKGMDVEVVYTLGDHQYNQQGPILERNGDCIFPEGYTSWKS